ncbi:MAG: hypothetical protein RR869_08685 [Lachnospiraceae bacterium]
MKFYKEPKNFEEVQGNYLVIGYYRQKAIVKDENNRLYFIDCNENEAPIGTVVSGEEITIVEKLNQEEQESIQEIYGYHKD